MITINANAKINLTLDVLGKRQDGYHEVCMVMQQIALCDVLTLRKLDKNGAIVLCGDVEGVAKPQDNLAYKAAELFLQQYKIACGVEITLQKQIPVAAGLAGGSSDAAAVLRGLNQLFSMELSLDALCELGAMLGSDIPFCIKGGTMLASGRGEILTELPALPQLDIVLVKPKIGISTAWVYTNYDKQPAALHPDNAAMQQALRSKDTAAICAHLGNVLENVTVPAHPQIAEIKQRLCQHGALAAMMSGSGPTVFAIAADRQAAESIAEKIRAEFPAADVFVTKTLNS